MRKHLLVAVLLAGACAFAADTYLGPIHVPANASRNNYTTQHWDAGTARFSLPVPQKYAVQCRGGVAHVAGANSDAGTADGRNVRVAENGLYDVTLTGSGLGYIAIFNPDVVDAGISCYVYGANP